MFQNWEKDQKQRKKRLEEINKDLTGKLENFDWNAFRFGKYEVKIESDRHFNKCVNQEYNRVNKVLDGTFWISEDSDFANINDEELGEKALEIWEILKPFYREDFYKPPVLVPLYINISKELPSGLTDNPKKYRVEPERLCNPEKDFIIDTGRANIWHKRWALENELKRKLARALGLHRGPEPSFFDKLDRDRFSLKWLYENYVSNWPSTELGKISKSNDLLERLIFLYVVKRAQNRDERAAEMLFEIFSEDAKQAAILFVSELKNNYGDKYDEWGELGIDDVTQMAYIFLRQLITGDDPARLLENISKLDDSRNIETVFTRKLGKKIRDKVGEVKVEIEQLRLKYQREERRETETIRALEREFSRFKKEEIGWIQFKREILRKGSKWTESQASPIYHRFIDLRKMTASEQRLFRYYSKVENGMLKNGCDFNGKPGNLLKEHDIFKDYDEVDLNRVHKIISDAAEHANRFLDEDRLSQNERELFEIMDRYEVLFLDIYAKQENIHLQIMALINPSIWITRSGWFNNKLFDATKNNSFKYWLFGTKKTDFRGALWGMLSNWVTSSHILHYDPVFRPKHISLNGPIEDRKSPDQNKKNTYAEVIPDTGHRPPDEDARNMDKKIDQIIKKGVKEKKIKNKQVPIIRACIENNQEYGSPKYNEIAKLFNISERTVIRIFSKFKEAAQEYM